MWCCCSLRADWQAPFTLCFLCSSLFSVLGYPERRYITYVYYYYYYYYYDIIIIINTVKSLHCVMYHTISNKANFISMAPNHNCNASIWVRKKNNLLRQKNLTDWKKKRWKKPQEEPQRRDPSPRMDRQAIDVQNRKKNHSLQVALTKYLIEIIIYVKCVDLGDNWTGLGFAKLCQSYTTSSQPWWPGRGQDTQDS